MLTHTYPGLKEMFIEMFISQAHPIDVIFAETEGDMITAREAVTRNAYIIANDTDYCAMLTRGLIQFDDLDKVLSNISGSQTPKLWIFDSKHFSKFLDIDPTLLPVLFSLYDNDITKTITNDKNLRYIRRSAMLSLGI